jgi:hypothetical protein
MQNEKKMLYWDMINSGFNCTFTNTDKFPDNENIYMCKECKKLFLAKDMRQDEHNGRVYYLYMECCDHLLVIDDDGSSIDDDDFKIIKGGCNSLIVSNDPLKEDFNVKQLVGNNKISNSRISMWMKCNDTLKIEYYI